MNDVMTPGIGDRAAVAFPSLLRAGHAPRSRRDAPRPAVLDVDREMAADQDALLAAFRSVVARRPASVILDYARVDVLRPSSLGGLVRVLVEARRGRQHLALAGLDGRHRDVLETARLAASVDLYPSVQHALTALQRGTR